MSDIQHYVVKGNIQHPSHNMHSDLLPKWFMEKENNLNYTGTIKHWSRTEKGFKRVHIFNVGFTENWALWFSESCICVFNVVVQYHIKDAGFFLDLFKAMVLCLFFHGVIYVLGVWLADKVLKVWASPCIPISCDHLLYLYIKMTKLNLNGKSCGQHFCRQCPWFVLARWDRNSFCFENDGIVRRHWV